MTVQVPIKQLGSGLLDRSESLVQHGPLTLLNERQAAVFLNVAEKTLRNWRCRGEGPVFVKLGGKLIRYRDADLTDFVERDVRSSTSNGGL